MESISGCCRSACAGRRRKTTGTTLVEILIVIVIFLIGILAIAQIFPGGFKILSNNRSSTVATALARAEIASLTNRTGAIPEAIVPVKYLPSGSIVVISADPSRRPDQLGTDAPELNSSGQLVSGSGDTLGDWKLLIGPNTVRRILGEGERVPSPRQVGSLYGGLMLLSYGPPIPSGGAFQSLLEVYGNDLRKVSGPPADAGNESYEFFIENPDTDQTKLYVEGDPVKSRNYRLTLSAYIQNGANVFKRDYVGVNVNVPPTTGYYAISLDTLLPSPGEVYKSLEYDTVRVQRKYEEVSSFDTDPYEYMLLDANLGVLMFNPAGYSYVVRDDEGNRTPLEAKVSYDVFDWRIIHDDFRVPDEDVPSYRMRLGNLKVKGHSDVDGTTYNGIELDVADGKGGTENRDVLLVDTETGGVLLELSASRMDGSNPKRLVQIDKAIGLLTFMDADGDSTNGVQGEVILPGASAPVDMKLNGRSIRALYRANGEWSVQPLKAAARYTNSEVQPGTGQFYIGGSNGAVGGNSTRIYFPWMDVDRKVTIGQIYYLQSGDTSPRVMEDQTFIVQGTPADPIGLPYIDITSVDPAAVGFDTATYGYAARDVRGASIAVRVLWNPNFFSLGDDNQENIKRLDNWGRGWRKTIDETFIQRSGA